MDSIEFVGEGNDTASGGLDSVICDDADEEGVCEEGEGVRCDSDNDERETEGNGVVADAGRFWSKRCREVEQAGGEYKDGEEEVVWENKVDDKFDEVTKLRSVFNHDFAKHAR